MNDVIWALPASVELLRGFLNRCTEELDITEEALLIRLEAEFPGDKNLPKSRALRKFINGETKKPSRLDAVVKLAQWLFLHVKELPDSELRKSALFEKVERLMLSAETANANRTGTLPSPEGLGAAIQLVTSLLHVSIGDLEKLERRLFRPGDLVEDKKRYERHFICYRYHSAPGLVAKSFLAVIGKSAEVPGICRFINVFRDRSGVQRISDGVILPMTHGVYLMGQAGNGDALKIVAVRDFSGDKPIQDGLMISYEDDMSIVSSRIVLAATDLKSSDEVEIGVFDEAVVAAEIAKFRSRLKNKVNFTLAEHLLFEGKPIDQSEMVAKVAEAFKGSDGKPKLTDQSGKPFNPASSAHYTFNSALKMWSAGED